MLRIKTIVSVKQLAGKQLVDKKIDMNLWMLGHQQPFVYQYTFNITSLEILLNNNRRLTRQCI